MEGLLTQNSRLDECTGLMFQNLSTLGTWLPLACSLGTAHILLGDEAVAARKETAAGICIFPLTEVDVETGHDHFLSL